MKRIKLLIKSILVINIMLFGINVKADTGNFNNIKIINLINSLEKTELIEKESFFLDDIYGNTRYQLIEFKGNGYLIYDVYTEDIMEYCLNSEETPYREYSKENVNLIYGGPLNYMIENNNVYYEINTMEIVDIESTRDFYDNLNNETINNLATTSNWTGIDSSYFSRYNGTAWRNTGSNANCCGPLSAAIMIAYYQDYLPSIITLNSSVRSVNSTSPGTLITKLKNATTSPTSTVPATLCNGVNTFLNNYNLASAYTGASSSTSTWSLATSKISAGRPVCIGISGLGIYNGVNPNDYGWHWVTAYGYRTINGSGYYRCIDNWGNYDVSIKTSTTVGIIYLSR